MIGSVNVFPQKPVDFVAKRVRLAGGVRHEAGFQVMCSGAPP